MPVTITFQGLCALVSEIRDVAKSKTLDVLLVDATADGLLDCAHEQKLDLPAANLEDPDGLTMDSDNPSRRTLALAGRQLKFLPGGVASRPAPLGAVDVDLIPEMKQVCAIGTVDRGCFSNPPTKPVAARVELPGGGTLIGDRSQLTPKKWSFAPKVVSCYNGFFVKQSIFELPAADHVVILVESLDGKLAGRLTLRSSNDLITISNLCTEDPEPLEVQSDDTVVYFALLDPPFSGVQPRARENDTCTFSPTTGSGLGCVPFLLSRS